MTAPLHMMKLCVGCDSPAALERWQAGRWGGGPARHVTRMWPTRGAALLAGGSLYWVFRGSMMARQRLLGLEEERGPDGVRRCALILEREIVAVRPTPRRAFQGWRYLDPADAPADVPALRAAEAPLPPRLARELAEMGLV